ncbi:MAG: tetratricopeptide repeat-containing glycosyltransferase family 2 protein [Clostridium sp.]|uniref:tetratricopeptide repeat-containing glycosyltransferase family 2 protein n=1 Tax=Clostridium sp. TaxID=1506 RepID=UPI003F3ED020
MIEISLCMIIKNEENILKRCLDSVKDFVDEIIIIDTGSTDKSKEIASEYTEAIYDFEWCDDFSKARNFAFSKATKEYIFWLDADDYITEENLKELIKLKETMNKELDAVSMHYSLSRDEKGNTTYSLRRNRLVKRSLDFKWIGRIHEYLEVSGRMFHSDISVHHGKDKPHTNRNIAVFRLMEQNNEEFTTRDRFYFANELYYNAKYEEAIEQYRAFLDSGKGWIEDLKTATANLIQCYNAIGKGDKTIEVICDSYKWGIPRADICCRAGEYFIGKNDYKTAIFWYKAAMLCEPEEGYMGINIKEYYTWIPSIQLCVCYSNLGDIETANYYNEMTAIYVPNSPKVEYNRNYLNGKFKERNLKVPKYKHVLRRNNEDFNS